MTIYLKFTTQNDAVAALQNVGYEISEWNDHFSNSNGHEWGTILPDPTSTDYFVNIYDTDQCDPSLLSYKTPEPLTPYNIVAGSDMHDVYRCVVVADSIKEICRNLVVQIAGPTHANMWSTGLSANGEEPITHWVNSGYVRIELAALLNSPTLLADGVGITIEEATAILSLADISDEEQTTAIARLGLSVV
jgi:hypothetical protein